MNSLPPLTTVRGVSILTRLTLRRTLNRWQSGRWFRKKAVGVTGRAGTAPKSGIKLIYFVILGPIMMVNGFNIGSRALLHLADATRTVAPASDGRIVVSAVTKAAVVKAYDALRQARAMTDPAKSLEYDGLWHRYLERTFTSEVNREILSEDEEKARLARMEQVFAERGPEGFVSTAQQNVFLTPGTWPGSDREPLFLSGTGLLLLLFTCSLGFTALGIGNKDLGQVEWSFEWLYTFPVSTRSLFASKLSTYLLLGTAGWLLFPLLGALYADAGWSFWGPGLPLAAAAGLYLLVLVASGAMAVEVAARKFLSLSQLKNLQALFTVLGMVFLFLYFGCSTSQPVADFLVRLARPLPALFAWNPAELPVLLARHPLGGGSFPLVLAAIAGWGILLVAISIGICERLTRDGLIRAGGPYQGGRQAKAVAIRAEGLRGIPGKEVILLLRDRSLMMQVLCMPLLLVGFYLFTNSNLIRAARGNFHHAATLAYCVGAYVLINSAMQILNQENKTLWQLLTFPESLLSILLKKVALWAGVALAYTGVTLLVLAYFSRSLHGSAFIDVFLALYGVVLYAFIAAGIGVLATNILETEARARMRVGMVYLYLLLVGMYAYAIYAPSIWSKLAQLVLSTLLAFALWQKVRDRLPYLLDPLEAAPPTISLADGLIAALSFFVLQGIVWLILQHEETWSVAKHVTLSYGIAGCITTAAFLFTFHRQRVPDLWRHLGYQPAKNTDEGRLWKRALLFGPLGGLAAAAGAFAYTHLLDLVPSWQIWKKDVELSSLLSQNGNSLWLCLLAVVGAPLFEEFIFRGLIYRGLRRSFNPLPATLASAALFALVHPSYAVIPVFGLGIVTAIAFERSRLLWAPMLAHAIYNACVLFLK